MTVKELIEELKAFPEDALIFSECEDETTVCTIQCKEPITIMDTENHTFATSTAWEIFID